MAGLISALDPATPASPASSARLAGTATTAWTAVLLVPILLVPVSLSGCFGTLPADREATETAEVGRGDPELEAPQGASPDQPSSDSSEHSQPGLDGTYLPAEIATVGFDRFTGAPIVLLRELGTGQVVPIWVGTNEARAIAMALHEIEFPRPLTHDLLRQVIGKLGGELEEVIVHDLVEGTYYGLLKLRVKGRPEPLLMDSRPSDGLALAARTGAAISISRKILDESPDYELLAPPESDQVVRLSGLTLVAPTPAHREELGLGERDGVLITRATGVAERQGLQRGDLLLEVNGEALESPVDFLERLEATPPGEPLELRIFRHGEESTLDFFPDRRPPEEERDEGPRRVA